MTKLKASIVCVSDLHVGGSTSLMPPGYTTPDGQHVSPSRPQTWLWDAWQNFIAGVKQRRRRGADLFVLVCGDVIEGNHHNTMQLISGDETAHVGMAVECLDPLLANADACAFVAGTPVHVGEVGRWEQLVAREFASRGLVKPEHGYTHAALHCAVHGLKVNAAHHLGGGSAPGSIEGAINREVVAHLYHCGLTGEGRADYLIRGHRHKHADTGLAYPTRGIALPCWQMPTGYVYRIDREALPSIGGVFIDIAPDGSHSVEFNGYQIVASMPYAETLPS